MWDEKHCENFLDALCMFPEQHLIKLERSRAFNPRTNVLTLVELWFPRFGIYYCHYINYFAKAVFVQSYITHVAPLKIDDRII